MPTTMPNKDKEVNAYLKQLTPEENQTYEIAKEHLGSSFDVYKSIGFLQYMDKNKK